jgi:L-serine dehydratase
MPEKSSVFDMIGPIMIGPSSSHTAGVLRIARTSLKLLGGIPEQAEIIFYNSFAQTYEGHGSDLAIIAGLLDLKTDDKRIKEAFSLAKEKGLSIKLNLVKGDEKLEVIGESRGGGLINIAEINGFKADISASLHTLVITAEDVKGSVAFISDVLAHDDCNIATMAVSRKGKNEVAGLVIEMDSGLKPVTLSYLRSLSWVKHIIYIPDIDR